jgi:hypothetical protein
VGDGTGSRAGEFRSSPRRSSTFSLSNPSICFCISTMLKAFLLFHLGDGEGVLRASFCLRIA